MRGLDPRIHLLAKEIFSRKKMDCRVKPGNDDSTTGAVGLGRREFITL
jgi:hypothetical protein